MRQWMVGAGLLVVGLIAAVEPAAAGSARATLAVGATVVKNCAIAAGPESVELRCSKGTQLPNGAARLGGDTGATWQSGTAAATAAAVYRAALREERSEPSAPGVPTVTLNF